MNHLLISTLNSQIQVMNVNTEEELIKFTGHVNNSYLLDNTILENEDNTYLISGSEDGSIHIWNVESGAGNKIQIGDNSMILNCLTSNKKGIFAAAGFPTNNNIQFFRIN